MIGLTFAERMSGTWYRLDAPAEERPIEFTVRARLPRLSALLGRGEAALSGRVIAEGLTRGADAEGTLGMAALVRERRLPYALSFRGDDGRRYRLDGAKEVAVMDLARSMTTLPAYLYDDDGNEVGRAVLRFDLRGDLIKLARSLRPLFGT